MLVPLGHIPSRTLPQTGAMASPVLIAFGYISFSWPFQLHFPHVRPSGEAKEPSSLQQIRFMWPLLGSHCSIKHATVYYLMGFLTQRACYGGRVRLRDEADTQGPSEAIQTSLPALEGGAWPLDVPRCLPAQRLASLCGSPTPLHMLAPEKEQDTWDSRPGDLGQES